MAMDLFQTIFTMNCPPLNPSLRNHCTLQKLTGDEPFEDETISQQVSSLLISLFILSGMNYLPFYVQQAAFFTINLICILVSYYISFLQR